MTEGQWHREKGAYLLRARWLRGSNLCATVESVPSGWRWQVAPVIKGTAYAVGIESVKASAMRKAEQACVAITRPLGLDPAGVASYWSRRLGSALLPPDRCWACNKGSITRSHVRPRVRGGNSTPDNVMLFCRRCHDMVEGRPPLAHAMMVVLGPMWLEGVPPMPVELRTGQEARWSRGVWRGIQRAREGAIANRLVAGVPETMQLG